MWAGINPQMDRVLRDHEEIHMKMVKTLFSKPVSYAGKNHGLHVLAPGLVHRPTRPHRNPI